MQVILSFDTEDFVTPESDDALLLLAREMTKRDIRGCFAVVADKARALRDRGRRDAVEALAAHEISYHSNDHHFFPLLGPTIEQMQWQEAVMWLLQHEAPGVADLEEMFGVAPVAWIKADSHWSAQSLHAFRLLGMRVYSARHFAAQDPRPWWYMNLLAVPYAQMLDRFIRQDGTARDILKLAVADFERRAQGLDDEDIIVYGTHPCMWVCRTFYDIHNVRRRGRPPAKEKWQPAPLLPPGTIRRNRKFFPMFLDYLRGAGVEFITYRQLLQRFSVSPAEKWLTRTQLGSLARRVGKRFAAAKVGGCYYSAAEILAALCWALARYEDGDVPPRVPIRRPIGPVETPRSMSKPLKVCSRAVLGAVRKTDAYISGYHRLPAGVDVGGHHFPPAQLLTVAAASYLSVLDGGKPSGGALEPGPDCPEDERLLAGAVIGAHCLPKGYTPTRLLEQGRLQSWTLKPGEPTDARGGLTHGH